MKFADILSALRRRWYLVVPGLVLAAAATFGAWTLAGDDYQRTATQVLLPGASSVPEDGNPYLYIGGLGQAADIVVRALSSPNVLDPVVRAHPGTDVTVERDPSTSGPVFVITVLAPTDRDAEAAVDSLVATTATVLDELQDEQDISARDRITVMPIFVDDESVVDRKNRLMITAFVAAGSVVIVLALSALADGIVLSRARRRR